MLLYQLRELIENGRVAKLRFKPQNSIHYIHEVSVKKMDDWYIHQLKIFLVTGIDLSDKKLVLADIEPANLRQFSQHTDLMEWSEVLKQLGHQAESHNWIIVDEEIDDPFPPERRLAP